MTRSRRSTSRSPTQPGRQRRNRPWRRRLHPRARGGRDRTRRAAARALYSEDVAMLDEAMLLEVFETRRRRSSHARDSIPAGSRLSRCWCRRALSRSKTAARTAVSQGGVYVNNFRRPTRGRASGAATSWSTGTSFSVRGGGTTTCCVSSDYRGPAPAVGAVAFVARRSWPWLRPPDVRAYSGSQAHQVRQWASQYTVISNDQTVVSGHRGHQALLAGRTLQGPDEQLRWSCDRHRHRLREPPHAGQHLDQRAEHRLSGLRQRRQLVRRRRSLRSRKITGRARLDLAAASSRLAGRPAALAAKGCTDVAPCGGAIVPAGECAHRGRPRGRLRFDLSTRGEPVGPAPAGARRGAVRAAAPARAVEAPTGLYLLGSRAGDRRT